MTTSEQVTAVLDMSNISIGVAPQLDTSIRMTDDELIRFSEQHKPYRFERSPRGEIITLSPNGGLSSTHEMYVSAMLFRWAEEDGTGMAFAPNIGFNLPDGSCLAPDAAWIPIERWNALTPRQQGGFLPFAPDFLIEVRSQSDSRRALERKMEAWMANGAQLAWLIDPFEGSVSISRAGGAVETIERPEALIAGAPVAGFVLKTARLWSDQ